MSSHEQASAPGSQWWRTAVIYQIYPRSFADATGDGIGDLPGVTRRLDALRELGIDAIWLSPFMTSPQKDAGYDVSDYRDVDPLFGTLADFDEMLAAAHEHGIRVIVDLVPNHSSDQHAWFQEALRAAPGSPERARYIFRDGRGEAGELPPNNWESVFGGGAWERVIEPDGTPGQWYLHIFDVTQPDFNWSNEEVAAEFRDILRFWLDRGVDGFRVDVAHGMIKAEDLPDYHPPQNTDSMGGGEQNAPYWGQEGVHDIYRDWHALLAQYEGDRALCGEAWLPTVAQMALWVRPDEMHQTFNFSYLMTPWDAGLLREVIRESLDAFGAVGAPSTWVLSNHDVVRHASRLALTAENPQGAGIGPDSPGQPEPVLGLSRARAATTLMLALPGSAYLYQGEELGLPEVIDLPREARQDPTWFRTGGERYGRDGCRVPIPWEASAPAYGFNGTGETWLPQPVQWRGLARAVQRQDAASTPTRYPELRRLRRADDLGRGVLGWLDAGEAAVAFRRGDITVVVNMGTAPIDLLAFTRGREPVFLVQSEAFAGSALPANTAAWLKG